MGRRALWSPGTGTPCALCPEPCGPCEEIPRGHFGGVSKGDCQEGAHQVVAHMDALFDGGFQVQAPGVPGSVPPRHAAPAGGDAGVRIGAQLLVQLHQGGLQPVRLLLRQAQLVLRRARVPGSRMSELSGLFAADQDFQSGVLPWVQEVHKVRGGHRAESEVSRYGKGGVRARGVSCQLGGDTAPQGPFAWLPGAPEPGQSSAGEAQSRPPH